MKEKETADLHFRVNVRLKYLAIYLLNTNSKHEGYSNKQERHGIFKEFANKILYTKGNLKNSTIKMIYTDLYRPIQ